jgi:apolipoprotein N-acyltransferase
VRHDHYHHRGGGDGQWILWLIGLAIAAMLIRALFWIAVVVIGAWLIFTFWRPILTVLVAIWMGIAFLGRCVGRLFRRRPVTPKLIAPPKTLPSE